MSYYWFNRQSCTKQKKDTQKRKLLSIVSKIKKLEKKSQEIVIKTCEKKKKAKLKSIKGRGIKN